MRTSWRTWILCGVVVACGAAGVGCDKAAPSAANEPPAVAAQASGEKRELADKSLEEAAPTPGGGGAAKAGAAPMREGDVRTRGIGDVGGVGALGLGVGAPPPMPAAQAEGHGAEVARGDVLIDPNGRFATTYRPGGGHLAAFESAVARGIVPAGERELVSDVGARYAPSLAAPSEKALAYQADLERAKIAPGGGPTHLRVALRASDKAAPRPHLSVHLVLDVSGSMQGESITRAREAARALVEKLDATDDFSLVTFSSDASVLVPDGPVGPRRESIKSTIATIQEGGGTNIGRGLELGYAEAHARSIPDGAVKVVLLLSDGRANAGITGAERLRKLALDAFQDGVQTSSFGLGTDYDGELMSGIASDGAGGYYYLRDPEQIAPALGTELDKRLDPVATAVEVRVRLKPDVGLLRVYGSRKLFEAEAARVRVQEVAADRQAQQRDGITKDRQDDAEGGMRFFIPAFARGDAHSLLFELKVPPGAGSRKIASIELKYKDRLGKKNVSDELPLSVTYANADAESAASADSSVARTVQGFAAGETLAEAAQRIARGDRNGAAALLSEREALLRTAADTLSEPLFLKDADRLARLRSHVGAAAGLGDPLVLAMLLETASRSHLR
jgi:Ca-activated chloride channel family protein